MEEEIQKKPLEVKTEGIEETLQLRVKAVRAERIEGKKLFSVGEDCSVLIPRFQAEILEQRLEKGEIWHVTPKRETTLVLAAFGHEPTPEEVTKERIEEFLEESLQNRASVEIQEGSRDLETLNFKVLTDTDRELKTFDMFGLADYMDRRWWQESQRREKLPRTREEPKEKRWEGGWITVPKGTPIRTGPLGSEGVHVEVQETTRRRMALPVISRKEEGSGIIHYNILGKGWVTMRWRGKKGEVL